MRHAAIALALLSLAMSARAASAPVVLGPTALVSAELVVTDARGTRRAPIAVAQTIPCAPGARCLRGVASSGGLDVALALGPGGRALPLSVEVHAAHKAAVRAIVVRLVLAARAWDALGRDYRPASGQRILLDRLDPKWITLHGPGGQAAVIVDDDVDTLQVTPTPGGVALDLELLSTDARPFGHLPRCGTDWRTIKGRVTVRDRYLVAGETLAAHGQLVLSAANPVAISPWPDGRLAAFAITDHADQTSASTLHALLAGASDAALEAPRAGLLGHRLPITKALFQRGGFPHHGARPQLEDPRVVALAELARKAGNEIAPHSATPFTDDRKVTDEALAWFAAHGARVWIDHQPQTNKEGFCQSGWHTTSGIADLLAKHGFRDVWDLTEYRGDGLDQRDPRHLDRRAPVIWPLGRLEPDGPDSLWMFRSTWAFLPTRQFFQRYAPARLDQLEHDRGLHVAHTYLETLHPPRTFFGRRNVLVQKGQRVTLDARLEALFADLARRRARGSLWVAPIGAIADRARALQKVRVRLSERGTILVERPGGLDGVTLHLAGRWLVGPQSAVAGQEVTSDATRVWLKACAAATGCESELTASGEARSGLLVEDRR